MLLWESMRIESSRSSNAFRQSVLFRVHEGVNIISNFPLKVGGDSASCSIGERDSHSSTSGDEELDDSRDEDECQ